MSDTKKKTEFEPVKLVRGEVAGVRLSGPERSLLQFSQDTFGEHLTRFLLSGLGKEDEARRWLFIIRFTDEEGTTLRRRLYVEADDVPEVVTSLPRRHEPLVMLALLRLLTRDRRAVPASLFYEQEKVLKLLGWEDTVESRLVIDEAVDRYSYLTYRWALSRKELAAGNLLFYRSRERFVSGYGHSDAEDEDGHVKRVINRVDFSTPFVEGLVGRSLFGLNWDNAKSIKHRVSP
jgi:hypothetical protein